MSVTGRLPGATTTFAAVIGDPVRHSLSPELLNTAFTHAEIDWVFGAFEVPADRTGDAVTAMRTLGFGGMSVTMPHKTAIIDHLDGLSPVAARLGAVNCVAWDGDRLVGHSTDGAGLVDTLRDDEGFEPEGTRCVVIGAGGAARAAVAALADADAAAVIVVNRTAEKAHTASLLAGERGRVGGIVDVADADLIVNATPIGMSAAGATEVPVDPTALSPGQLVFDMIYDPPVTRLVADARAAGVRAVGGIGMLVHQAAHAFGLWTGRQAPTDAMTAVVRAELERRTR